MSQVISQSSDLVKVDFEFIFVPRKIMSFFDNGSFVTEQNLGSPSLRHHGHHARLHHTSGLVKLQRMHWNFG
jgi:hypothetical protein